MNEIIELKAILRQVGPENIWRPVYIPGNILLAEGAGDMNDGLPNELQILDFKNKTIVDLGCNFGYYSFVAEKAGAEHVLGIDKDNRIIRGCELLKSLYGIDNVAFLAMDFTRLDNLGTFDIGMMIDLIGKNDVKSGKLKKYLNLLESVSEKEMLLTIRPVYNMRKHLNNDFSGLMEKYPGNYVHDNSFFTLDYIRDRFKTHWHMEIVSTSDKLRLDKKEPLHFIHK